MARRPNRAEQAAIALLEEFGVKDPPVAVDRIAKKLGVSVRLEPLEGGLSAVLFREEGGRQVLGVNSLHATVRQRFSIAHELGHLRLHEDILFVDGLVRRDDKSSMALDAREIEANAFAAELLMPRHMVLRALSDRVPQGGAVELGSLVRRMAREFHVSEQAMEFRLVNLGVATSF